MKIKQRRSPSYFKRLEKRKQERNKEKEAKQAVHDQDVVDCKLQSEGGKAEQAVPAMSVVDSRQTENLNVAAAEAANETADEAEVLAAVEAANKVAEKAEVVAAQADKEQKEKDVAEKQDMKGKVWQCVMHDCVVEYGKHKDLTCSCCDNCEGYVYGREEDEDDDSKDPL